MAFISCFIPAKCGEIHKFISGAQHISLCRTNQLFISSHLFDFFVKLAATVCFNHSPIEIFSLSRNLIEFRKFVSIVLWNTHIFSSVWEWTQGPQNSWYCFQSFKWIEPTISNFRMSVLGPSDGRELLFWILWKCKMERILNIFL